MHKVQRISTDASIGVSTGKRISAMLVLALTFLFVGNALSQTTVTRQALRGQVAYYDSLTAPGNFDTLRISPRDYFMPPITEITFQITIHDIDTSVDIRAEGSMDGSHWFNLDSSGTDTTYTTDDTSGLRYKGATTLQYFRLVFVSETGGDSSAVIILRVMLG